MIYFAFDVDETIFRRSQPFYKACNEVLAKRIKLDWKEFFKVRNKYGDVAALAALEGRITINEMQFVRLNNALREFGEETTYEEVEEFEECYQYHLDRITPDEPYEELFTYLKKNNVPMAIITNGPSGEHQRGKVRAMRINRWIPEELWYVSADKGFPKPDINMYKDAEKDWEAEADNCWYIGDNFTADIWGACRAGWHSIWYNTDNKAIVMPEGEMIMPDYEVHTPGELMDTVRRIVGK